MAMENGSEEHVKDGDKGMRVYERQLTLLGHVVRDCPTFKCFKCGNQGHYARECQGTEKCNDCGEKVVLCVCGASAAFRGETRYSDISSSREELVEVDLTAEREEEEERAEAEAEAEGDPTEEREAAEIGGGWIWSREVEDLDSSMEHAGSGKPVISEAADGEKSQRSEETGGGGAGGSEERDADECSSQRSAGGGEQRGGDGHY